MVRCTSFLLASLMALVWTGSAMAAPKGVTSNVTVRGFWAITVVNADGTVASKTEFENAYVPGELLADLLTGALQRIGFGIRLEALGVGADRPCSNGDVPTTCHIRQVGVSTPGYRSNDLTAVSEGGKIVLAGSVVAAGGDITRVSTVVEASHPQFGAVDYDFTAHVLAEPIAVAEGQQVQARVTISFGGIQ